MKKTENKIEKYTTIMYVAAWFLCLVLLLITQDTSDRR